MIELRFIPTAAEYNRAQLYLQRRLIGHWYWPLMLTQGFLLGIAGVGFMMIYTLAYNGAESPSMVSWAAGLFFVGAYATLFLRLFLRRFINRILYRPGGYLTAERVMRFDETGFTGTGPLLDYRVKWSEVLELTRTKKDLFLVADPAVVLYVPCRIAASAEELERLWSQLQLWHTAAK